MTTARASLTQSTTLFKSFMAMTAGNEHVRALQKRREVCPLAQRSRTSGDLA
ncbi:hypothetical protein ACLK17_11555 [Escherichia coli]